MTFNLFQMVSNDLENSRLHVLSLLLNPHCFFPGRGSEAGKGLLPDSGGETLRPRR